MKLKFFVAVMLFLFPCTIWAQFNQAKSPFLPGEIWWCSQGNDKTTSHFGSIAKSWDFNWSSGWSDQTRPVVAVFGGPVTYAANRGGAWGNVVAVYLGDYYVPSESQTLPHYGYYAHLDQILVKVGEYVQQGQVVGLCGGTGSPPSHIHYHTARGGTNPSSGSIPITFADIGLPDGDFSSEPPPNVSHYTSANTPLFDAVFTASGGSSAFGQTIELSEYGWGGRW